MGQKLAASDICSRPNPFLIEQLLGSSAFALIALAHELLCFYGVAATCCLGLLDLLLVLKTNPIF